jgi:hypothetical protein
MIKTDSHTPIENLEKIQSYAVRLEDMGLKTAGTRISTYIKEYKTVFIRKQSTDPEERRRQLTAYTFAGREIHELSWILDVMCDSPPPGFLEIMDQVLGGNPLARDDSNELNSRDFQFELRIASYFIRVGYKVDLSQQTDIIARKDGLTFFVECKRIKSQRQVERRIKKAFKQLRLPLTSGVSKSHQFGVVALDISKILHPHLGLSTSDSDSTFAYGVREQISNFRDEYAEVIETNRHPKIIEVWLQVVCPCFNTETNQSSTLFSSLHNSGPWSSGPKYVAYQILKDVFSVT